ncbi:FliT [Bacillus atrophaeus UCMB-5137]|uniref:flagellar protein FliT n=1 Tax=Bacillus atrophaeus TaxID=1452 RepID=UPI00032E2AF0|nr:flagellar protein FliT [Bacillus atrophaeus]AKL86519.1 FliT [Bacillus atrophaeus UCMB-5137]
MRKTAILYSETKSMLSHIQDAPESDDLLKEIEDFVSKRAALINQISPPLSEEEQKQIKLVLTWDQLIVEEMQRLKQSIKVEIQQLKKKRAVHTTYLNPYNNISIDGRYYDKRK